MTNKADKPVYKVLVVDDNHDIGELLEYNLSLEGYEVKNATNGLEAIKVARSFLPHLIIMDVMMPEMDGIEAGRQIRSIPELENICLLYLTARTEEYAEIAAFEIGADDYITKPVRIRSLLSRVKALLNRYTHKRSSDNPNILTLRNLTINRDSYTIQYGTTSFQLPRKEFELLYFLAKAPDKVFTRDELLTNIWGTDVYVTIRTVDVHVRKLREKIGQDAIHTVKGIGYKLNPIFE